MPRSSLLDVPCGIPKTLCSCEPQSEESELAQYIQMYKVCILTHMNEHEKC